MASLQDQLMKAGIVDQKKAKKIKQEQRKQAKQQPKGSITVNEAKEQAKRVIAEKAVQDKLINKQRQAEAEKKAIQAQIFQLIELNRIHRGDGDVAYQFTDNKKIKKLYVTERLHEQLSNGLVAIAKLADHYELVPTAVAEKIKQRDEKTILVLNISKQQAADEDDPYADYQIPDDLMW